MDFQQIRFLYLRRYWNSLLIFNPCLGNYPPLLREKREASIVQNASALSLKPVLSFKN